MAKHHKKSRHTSRKHRVTRKHRRSNRKQHGGSNCAAYPHNRDVFAQRGGMAPFTAGDNYLLDAATRVQAEVAPLDNAFAELPSVMPRQMGGQRSRSRRSMRRSHSMRRRHTMRRKSHRRKTHRRKQQRGGMAPFGYELALPKGADAAMNPQFQTEGSVNPLYGEFRGAQTA